MYKRIVVTGSLAYDHIINMPTKFSSHIMADKKAANRRDPRRDSRKGRKGPLYAAVDLGTNNCRLLVAEPWGKSFRVVDSHSQIARLGEGLHETGRLSDAAIERADTKLAEREAARDRAQLMDEKGDDANHSAEKIVEIRKTAGN